MYQDAGFDILVCSAKGRDGYIGSRGKMSFDLNKRDTALKSDDSRCFFFSVFFLKNESIFAMHARLS